jgi:predicted Zn-dependent protease
MKFFAVAIVLALGVPAVQAQFGGLGRLKDRIDRAKEKSKPVTERAQRAVDTFQPWNDTEEQAIGEAAAAKMVKIFGLAEDPKIGRYVNLVGQAVAQFAPRQIRYRFGVLNTDIVGAFAIPGGYIFITKSSLDLMKNEAQLAGALGHEIVHISERHLEREIRSKQSTNWAVEEARAQAGSLLQDRADALVKDLLSMKLSREKEDSADKDGAELAARAGYSPVGLFEFLSALSEAEKKEENRRLFGQLLSTHPPFDERVANLQPRVSGRSGKTLEARFQTALAVQP